MLKHIFIGLCLLCLQVVVAQVPDTVWTWHSGLSGNDGGGPVLPTPDDGWIAVASAAVGPEWNSDIVVFRGDSNGNQSWVHYYGGPLGEHASDIEPLSDGGFVITGYTNSYGSSNPTGWVIRIDSEGDTLWTRTIDGIGDNSVGPACVIDDEIIAAGSVNSGPGDYDLYLVGLTLNGEISWTRAYASPDFDEAAAIKRTDDQHLLIGCTKTTWVNGGPERSPCIHKIGLDGDTVWTRTYTVAPFSSYTTGLCVSPDGGAVIVGYTPNPDGDWSDLGFCAKVDSDGTLQWNYVYGSGSEMVLGIVALPQGVVASGESYSHPSLIRLGYNGTLVWSAVYDIEDSWWAISASEDGGYLLSGSSWSPAGYDACVIRTEPDPCVSPQPAAPQMVIRTDSDDVVLNWKPVTHSGIGCPLEVSEYLVFSAPDVEGPYAFVGATVDTAFTDAGILVSTRRSCYVVLAQTGSVDTESLTRGMSIEVAKGILNVRK